MRARLTLESGLASPPVCEVDSTVVVHLGRNRDNTLILQDRHASRWHARIFASNGSWYITDQDTTNGTRVDGRPIRGDTPLRDGQQIGIGDTLLRFTILSVARAESAEEPQRLAPLPEPDHATLLQTDELTTLFRFLNEAPGERSLQRLVRLALQAVRSQTGAELAGYLGLDSDDPEFIVVEPPRAGFGPENQALSRKLTDLMLRLKRSIWLCASEEPNLDSESLARFRDALCIPLRASQDGGDPSASLEGPLGALHVYRSDRPFHERELRFCEVLAGSLAGCLHLLRARRALEADNSRLRIHIGGGSEELVGTSKVMANLRDEVCALGDANCSVLILGESGVGKELVTLGLHRESPRRAGPLITVNCAALTPALADSELFGHARGSFTSAVREHDGFFLQADMGTLFLDEIGDLSLEIQAKLLRAIENRRFRPVGAAKDVKANVRILAATNRDLEQDVRTGNFRRDLFYRFVSRIRVPPLREHLEDVPVLVEHFLAHLGREYRRQVQLSPEALERLMTFSWPGNVRQLRCVLESALARTREGGVIAPDQLHLEEEQPGPEGRPVSLNLKDVESWAIRAALLEAGGNQAEAARLLGIHRTTLIDRLKKYGIEARRGEADEGSE
jgi:Nif-specific regulatory protein